LYYIKNLLLNLTLIAPLAMPALPLLILARMYDGATAAKSTSTTATIEQQQRQLREKERVTSSWWDLVSILSSFYLWLLILVPRPHKEERFLFPIYPALCLAAVVTCDTVIQLVATRLLERRVSHSMTSPQLATTAALIVATRALLIAAAILGIVLPIILLSLARTAALHKYYTAPLHIYAILAAALSSSTTTSTQSTAAAARVCTCGEWYRFPSSFFLTSSSSGSSSSNLKLGYLPSSFGGQLPQDFSIYGSGPASRDVLQPFNDQNRHQPERYVSNYQQDCLWIVDLQDDHESDDNDHDSTDSSDGENLCQSLTRGHDDASPSAFELIASVPFLDASRTVSSIHRVLYIPYFHERAVERGQVSYQRYVLYKKKKKGDDDDDDD
jgi:alpha-1,2-mannosyltransferase